jgi:hypothetical protein
MNNAIKNAIKDAVQAVEDKRINKENAFDQPFIDTDQVKTYFETYEEEQDNIIKTRWLKTSGLLAAGAKIYGFRVDNTYQDAHKVLGALNRGGEVELEIIQKDDEDEEEGKANKPKKEAP